MAQHQNIGLTLVSPLSLLSDLDDWLKLEQPEWQEARDDGFIAWLLRTGKELSLTTAQEYYSQYKSQCSDDGSLEVEIQVHRSRPDLAYAITASYGTLSDKFLHTNEHTYSETIKKASSFDLEKQIVGTISATWEGGIIGEDLAFITPPPKINQVGSVLDWGVICTGTMRLKYSEEHDTYILTILPRTGTDVDPEDISTAYQSTVTAVYVGGEPEVHDVDLPDMSGYCGYSVESHTDPDDEQGDCYDLYIKYHKCTGEEISRELVRVACPEPEDEGDGLYDAGSSTFWNT